MAENLKLNAFDLNSALYHSGLSKNKVNVVSANRCFSGLHLRVKHFSKALDCDMTIGLFLPPNLLTEKNFKAPALYWLSGLTCTDQNFLQKAGAMQLASELGLVLICPDTSPRGEGVPDTDSYDLGQGAGFYINATEEPWTKHYQMYDYVNCELINWCEKNLPITDQRSICGHSMGGHAALVNCFRNPGLFRSVSAFAPICNPSQTPWGEKAFTAYLGSDRETWKQYDASLLLANLKERLPLLIDQGTSDEFLAAELSINAFAEKCEKHQHPLELRMQDGYDHSYFFISTFINDHIRHHAKALQLI